MDRSVYEQKAETFLTEVLTEQYEVGAGLKDTLELTPIYTRHADLFTGEVVHSRLLERDTPAGRYLADFAVTGFMENQVKSLSEEITNAELAAKVPWDGQELAYQDVPILIMNEDDRQRRAALAHRYYMKQGELNPKRARRWNQLHRIAQELGFDGYVALYDELRALSLRRLAGEMEWLLAMTGDQFEAELHDHLIAGGVPPEEAGVWDVSAVFRGKQFDALFPADRMLPALKQTLAGLGIDLDAQQNLLLDTETRPLKSPRAFCADIRTPQDVRLVIKPAGGVDDYRALFHEAGHAEHFTHIDPDLAFPYRRLGDSSVTETYAFLLEHLNFSPAWLEGILHVKPAQYEPLRRAALFQELFMVRRYGAKLNYELELHTGLVEGKAGAYVHWLGRGSRVRIPPERYLSDVDDAFYVAQYLRAWIFEAQLRRYLEQTFGLEWFARKPAGDFLKELWHIGQRDTVEELAAQIGAQGLDSGPLVEQLTAT